MPPKINDDRWMSCSACRRDIAFGAKHFVCSVSTCNRSRTRLVFCSVPCWDSHVAVLRHRDAWAVEAVAPTSAEAEAQETGHAFAQAETPAPSPAPARPPAALPPSRPASTDESDILIVVSKMKKYIRDRSGMNTSDSVAEVLSDHVRALCDLAIRTAGANGRRTVLDRDVPRLKGQAPGEQGR
jgi:hypothetical protein